VTASDGVELACEVAGAGTPLVMVHGAGSARWTFDLMRPHLEGSYEVWTFDRRGRGDSADDAHYSIEQEFDDVVAVLVAAGAGALLFGHSYGGLLAAGAAGRVEVPRLALYEGPMGGVLADQEWIERFEGHLAAGEPDLAIREFMADVGGYTDAEIDAMQGTPYWTARVAAASTVPRELRAEGAFGLDSLRLAELETPALLLVGTESPSWARRSTEAFAAALPRAEVHELEGQGHGAAMSAPELLASEVRAFLG
jgi:pimeloyl-ACP methyl ester carboxylesterase